MSEHPALPDEPALMALAHRVLLAHAEHGDAARSLRGLCDALAIALPGATVRALSPAAAATWVPAAGSDPAGGHEAPFTDELASRAAQGPEPLVYGARLLLPLLHLGRPVGLLDVESPGADLGRLAHALDPVARSAAVLLGARSLRADGAAERQLRLIRAALDESGTSAWEWDITTDVLADIDQGERLLGYPPGRIGRTQADWNRVIHPDDLAVQEAVWEAHARGRTDVYHHLYRARAHDGSWRWLEERGRVVERDAAGRPRRMVGTQVDVTERIEVEQASREAVERLRRIAGHVPGMLYEFLHRADGQHRFTYVSQRCADLLDCSAEALEDDPARLFARVPEADRARLVPIAVGGVSHGQLFRAEFRFEHPRLGMRWLLGLSSPSPTADGQVVWHGYLQDVTELRELERVNERHRDAEAASQAKSEFLSCLSHELRTPLNAVLGFAQLLAHDPTTPLTAAQSQRVAMIRQAGEHLLAMIGDLLDLGAAESGRLPLQTGEFAPAELATECLDLMRPQAVAARVHLAPLLGDTSLRVRADPRRVRQILLNLLGNAVKYNRTGGDVRLRLGRAADDAVTLTVEDTGLGIAPEDLPRLFQPFTRLGRDQARVPGSGVGLALTRRLAQAMDGDVTVSSVPGAGSRFTVRLPGAPAPGPADAPAQ
jgi:PAS domain S-box-containing protein